MYGFCLGSTIYNCRFLYIFGQQIEGNCKHLKSVGFLLKIYENMSYNMFKTCKRVTKHVFYVYFFVYRYYYYININFLIKKYIII